MPGRNCFLIQYVIASTYISNIIREGIIICETALHCGISSLEDVPIIRSNKCLNHSSLLLSSSYIHSMSSCRLLFVQQLFPNNIINDENNLSQASSPAKQRIPIPNLINDPLQNYMNNLFEEADTNQDGGI